MSKMFSTDQISKFLKVQYLKNELRYEVGFAYVSNRSTGLGLTWLGTPRILQVINQEHIQKTRYG